MKRCMGLCLVSFFTLMGMTAPLARATSPYTENFTNDAANWKNVSNVLADYMPSGGPDGSSHISTTATAYLLPDRNPLIVFRGQDNFGSSNHAFEGNWLSSGIVEFSDYVWHNAPISLPFWVRFANPTGSFSAVGGDNFTDVPPNTWTKLTYKIAPSEINVTLFPEGPPSSGLSIFNSTFSNVGRIQIGYWVPVGFGSDVNTYTFRLDQPSIAVPEPTCGLLLASGTLIGLLYRRRSAF